MLGWGRSSGRTRVSEEIGKFLNGRLLHCMLYALCFLGSELGWFDLVLRAASASALRRICFLGTAFHGRCHGGSIAARLYA